MKKISFPSPRRRAYTGSHILTIIGSVLFGMVLLTACHEPSRQDWPQLTVLASASLHPVLVSELGEFEKMDGTLVDVQYLDDEALMKRLRSGERVDVVLLDNWADLETLAGERFVLGSPWQFRLVREGVVAIAPEDSAIRLGRPEDLLDPNLGRIGFVENGQGYTSRLTKGALQANGVLKPLQEGLWQAHSLGSLVRALRHGKVAVGLVSEKDYQVNERGWHNGMKILLRIPLTSERPDEYAGGVVSGSRDVKAARRFWSFIEKAIRVHQPGLRSQTQERM